ncbi:MAG: Crp/Fnr family transcriptional regulator [Bacteroidota bacterium]
MNEILQEYINRYVQLNKQEQALFNQLLDTKVFGKKALLFEEGQVCRHQYFLLEGLVRTFYVDSSGNERITQFGKEHWWVTDMDSFIHESPSRVSIQALEKTTALVISKERLEEAYQKIPKIERLFRKISEKWLIAQQRHSRFYMKASSKDRYYGLVQSIPNFVQRVPQYMIASYLDITPEYLSELRKASR